MAPAQQSGDGRRTRWDQGGWEGTRCLFEHLPRVVVEGPSLSLS